MTEYGQPQGLLVSARLGRPAEGTFGPPWQLLGTGTSTAPVCILDMEHGLLKRKSFESPAKVEKERCFSG